MHCNNIHVSYALWKFTSRHFPFTKDLHYHLFWNPKRVFHFYDRKVKSDKSSAFTLQKLLQKQRAPQTVKEAPPGSFPRNHTRLSINSPELWTVLVSICAPSPFLCASISKSYLESLRELVRVLCWMYKWTELITLGMIL